MNISFFIYIYFRKKLLLPTISCRGIPVVQQAAVIDPVIARTLSFGPVRLLSRLTDIIERVHIIIVPAKTPCLYGCPASFIPGDARSYAPHNRTITFKQSVFYISASVINLILFVLS